MLCARVSTILWALEEQDEVQELLVAPTAPILGGSREKSHTYIHTHALDQQRETAVVNMALSTLVQYHSKQILNIILNSYDRGGEFPARRVSRHACNHARCVCVRGAAQPYK